MSHYPKQSDKMSHWSAKVRGQRAVVTDLS
jgi:hypothetical protein